VTTAQLHPWAEADIAGITVVKITGGQITLDALALPYATATIDAPWAGTIGEIDPRDDIRIIIRAGNSGHWEWAADPDAGYGHGTYGHGHYGGSS
jgi:hypothetical protein